MSSFGRTHKILTAIEGGAVTPSAIGAELDLDTGSIRSSLARLRQRGDVECDSVGDWTTVPRADSRRILDTLELIESDSRRWSVDELAAVEDLTVGQILVIAETLATAGLIEKMSATMFRMMEATDLDRY